VLRSFGIKGRGFAAKKNVIVLLEDESSEMRRGDFFPENPTRERTGAGGGVWRGNEEWKGGGDHESERVSWHAPGDAEAWGPYFRVENTLIGVVISHAACHAWKTQSGLSKGAERGRDPTSLPPWGRWLQPGEKAK